MPRDLLDKLHSQLEDDDKDASEPGESVTIEIVENNNQPAGVADAMAEFRLKAQRVQDDLDRIRDYTEHVKDIHAMILSTPDNDKAKNEELEDVMAQVKVLAARTRQSLKEVKEEADNAMRENSTSAVSRMKLIQEQALTKVFVDLMTAYNNAQMEYRNKCKARIKRHLDITRTETTDEELEEMIESGKVTIFTQSILSDSSKAKQALADVTARHNDIMQLEKSIRELRDLFLEMAVLVESQGELIDRIEYNVSNAVEYVDKAKKETAMAKEYQKSAFKKKLWLIAILAIIILIIILCFVL